MIEVIDSTFPDVPARRSCHQAAKLAGWFGAYSALFSMPEMFYIEPVNELVNARRRDGRVALERADLEAFALP